MLWSKYRNARGKPYLYAFNRVDGTEAEMTLRWEPKTSTNEVVPVLLVTALVIDGSHLWLDRQVCMKREVGAPRNRECFGLLKNLSKRMDKEFMHETVREMTRRHKNLLNEGCEYSHRRYMFPDDVVPHDVIARALKR